MPPRHPAETARVDNAAAPARPTVRVVCGVVWSQDGRYLLAQRPKGRIWEGYWEFPGGKIEAGESAIAAIARELHEELGIRVGRAEPWLLRVFDYPHAHVRLHFFQIREWTGSPAGLEGQALHWQVPGQVCQVMPLLPANVPILRALDMPALFPVTPDTTVPHRSALVQVNARLSRLPWRTEARWLQIRRGELSTSQWRDWSVLCAGHGVRPVPNTTVELAQSLGADSLHLSNERLAALQTRPDLSWVGASVHDRAAIDHAATLGLDYAILGSVMQTATHPGRSGLGWTRWHEMAQWAALPVYAIGGLTPGNLDTARQHGASGIAMIGAAWNG